MHTISVWFFSDIFLFVNLIFAINMLTLFICIVLVFNNYLKVISKYTNLVNVFIISKRGYYLG